jgi:hypothetical protein
MLLALLFSVSSQVQPAQLVRAEIERQGNACVGAVGYELAPSDADVRTALGATVRELEITVPCARLDAVDGLLALPSNLSGKLDVRTERIAVRRKPDASCAVSVTRRLAPSDAAALDAVGARVVVRELDVACSQLTGALTGALVRKASAARWPSGVAVPLAVEP